jgi:r-opsin
LIFIHPLKEHHRGKMNPSLSFNTTLIRSARAIQPNVHFGYPPGVSLTDFVTDDMKALVSYSNLQMNEPLILISNVNDIKQIHPHWSKFPPVNPMWHYLLGTIYIFLGVVSLFGNGIVIR